MGFRDVQAQVRTADGVDLTLFGLVPERPRGALVFVHGLGEHVGRYAETFAELAVRGWASWGADLRGHGRSGGPRGHVERFEDYLLDVDALLEFVRVSDPRSRVALVGHSMGGLIVLRALRLSPGAVEAAFVSNPALAPHPSLRPPWWKSGLARLLSRFFPATRFETGIDPRDLSRDPAVGEEYARDPLVQRRVTARWYVEVDRAGGREAAEREAPTVPVRVLLSSDDRLVDPAVTESWARRLGGTVTFGNREGAFHELFQPPTRGGVVEDLDAWLVRAGFPSEVDPIVAEADDVADLDRERRPKG